MPCRPSSGCITTPKGLAALTAACADLLSRYMPSLRHAKPSGRRDPAPASRSCTCESTPNHPVRRAVSLGPVYLSEGAVSAVLPKQDDEQACS